MHDWGNYPGDEICRGAGDGIAAIMRNMDKPPPRNSPKKEEKSMKAPMPDIIYFVTWCDPAKYNKGPEQEYYWCSEKSNALAKVGECHLAGYENVALYEFKR